MGQEGTITESTTSLIFSYGTLKRGFSNHVLMQDLIRSGDATFKGVYRTVESYPLVCGPYRVPFLLNIPGSGHRVSGELYAVSPRGLARVDELEGISRGHYVRLPILLVSAASENHEENALSCAGDEKDLSCAGEEKVLSCAAEAYYAHDSYEKELWERNEGREFEEYTEKEAKGYVRRKDRPQNLTFLDHIRIFVSSPCD